MSVTSTRPVVASLAAVLLVSLVLPVALAAESPAPLLHPPSGQERIKPIDEVRFGGTVDPAATLMGGQLVFRGPDGQVIPGAAIDVMDPDASDSRRLRKDADGELAGSWQLAAPIVPDHASTIELAVRVTQPDGTSAAGSSPRLEVDDIRPFVDQVLVTAPRTIQVVFNEVVTYPGTLGDNPSDWRIDGQRDVLSISGSGHERVLTIFTAQAEDATPFVEFAPVNGTVSPVYEDLAKWSLDPEPGAREQEAVDGIAPRIPAIATIEGQAATGTVVGGTEQPVVRIADITTGHTARLWREADGVVGLSSGDALVGSGTAQEHDDGTYADVETSPLPEGSNTLYAIAVDAAGNRSPGADDAVYELDLTGPRAVSAMADGRDVTVRFSEAIVGTDRPDDWKVTTGGPVEAVTGSDETRLVRSASGATGSISWTAPTGGGATPYHDGKGNALPSFTVEILQPGDLHMADAAAVEGTPLAFTVTVSRPEGDHSTYWVDYATEDATATVGEDYTQHSGRLTFTEDETAKTVSVATVDDGREEGPETVILRLSNAGGGATLPDPATATGTILEPMAGGLLSVFDASGQEGGTARAIVQLEEATTEDVTVRWTTEDGTAQAGSDYTAGSGTVRIPAGTREQAIVVLLLEDGADEATESFSIELSDPVNGTLQRATATVSIYDGSAVPPGIGRVSGPSRVETSAALSKAFYASADTIVIATANAYPDALAGAPLAEKHSAPILLTTSERLHPAVADEVRRLGATTALVLGGPNALSAQVDTDLRAAGVRTVRRLSGKNRFDTARIIASEMGGDAVYIVEGANADPKRGWPDAVAVSALAAAQQRPILLVERDRLPTETSAALDRLSPTRATIVGGPAAVDDSVRRAVDTRAGVVDRVAGRTRYETSRAVANKAVVAGFDPGDTFFATGDDWPDSLSASPAVARTGGVLLLVDSDRLDDSPPAREWLVTHRDRLRSITLIGGTKAISETVASQIRSQSGLQPR